MKLPPIGNGKSTEQLDLERAAAQKMRDDVARLQEDGEAGIKTIINDDEAENYVFGAADFQQQVLSQEKESSVLASTFESVVNGFVKTALDKVVEANVAELEESKRKLSGESAQPQLSQQQSDVLQQIDPDLQLDLRFGEELVDKLESDPAKAKTAFENISALLKDDAQYSAQKKSAIGAIGNEINDSALQIFANMSQEIIDLKAGGKISEEEEIQVIQKLTEQFAFLTDGKNRTAADSVYLALVNAEKVSESGVILDALGKGLLDTLNSIKEKNQLEYDPSGLEEEDYKDDFEEEDEVKQDEVKQDEVKQDEVKQDEVKQDEVEENEVERDDPEKESEKEKKKKSQSLKSADTQDSEGPEKDQKKKRGISYKEFEELVKVAARPTFRLAIALALAFGVPGFGPVLAMGFLLATGPNEEQNENEKKPEDLPLANEADNYLEDREKIRQQIERGEPDTEVKKATHGVVLEQQEALGEMTSTLKTASSSLNRVDAPLQVDEEKKKQVVSKVSSKQLDEQTLKDVKSAGISLDLGNMSDIENSSSNANSGAITSTSKSGQPQQII